jgi:hypothetical protein
VESMDVFEATPLFKKLWPKLLKSYCLDAINADQDAKDLPKCTVDDAQKFLADASATNDAANAERSEAKSKSDVVVARRSDRFASFSLHDRKSNEQPATNEPAQAGMIGGAGIGGGAVHMAGFAK